MPLASLSHDASTSVEYAAGACPSADVLVLTFARPKMAWMCTATLLHATTWVRLCAANARPQHACLAVADDDDCLLLCTLSLRPVELCS